LIPKKIAKATTKPARVTSGLRCVIQAPHHRRHIWNGTPA
jgi:hypothetical protein